MFNSSRRNVEQLVRVFSLPQYFCIHLPFCLLCSSSYLLHLSSSLVGFAPESMAASEGLVADQTADEQSEEMKVPVDIKQNGEGSFSATKAVVGKGEEGKIKSDNSPHVEAVAIGAAEETEVKKSDTAVEANKVEDNDQGLGSDVLSTDGLEVLKDPRQEYDGFTPQSAVEDNREELKNESYASDTREPPIEAEEKSTDDLITSIVQELESEAAIELAVSESMPEELKSEDKEISASPRLVSEIESKSVEPPMVSAVMEPASNVIETPIAVEEISAAPGLVSDTESKSVEPPIITVVIEPASNAIETSIVVKEISNAPNLMSDTEAKSVEPPIVSSVIEPAPVVIETPIAVESAAISQDEDFLDQAEAILESKKEEVTDLAKLDGETKHIHESVLSGTSEEADKANETEDVEISVASDKLEPEKTRADPNADDGMEKYVEENSEGNEMEKLATEIAFDSVLLDPSSAVGLTGCIAEPQFTVEEEKQEKTIEVAEVSLSEGANASEEVGTGEEKKKKSLEGVEPTLIETSKDVVPTTEVPKVSYEAEKASKIVERAEEQGESLGGEKITSPETPKYYDAEDAKLSSAQGSIVSKYVEMVEENTKSYEGGNRTSIDTSKDIYLDLATEVAEFSTEVEKASKTVERDMEDDSLETNKTTLVGTFKDLHAATEVPEVLFEEENISRNVEMDKGNNETLEGDKEMILSGTSEEANVTTNVAEASSKKEKASRNVEMDKGNDETLEGDKEMKLSGTSEEANATTDVAEAAYEGEKASGNVETDKGNDQTLEGDKEMILSGTSEEANTTTDVAEAYSEGEKYFGGFVMVKGKDENLEDAKKQKLVETSKDQDASSEVPEFSSKAEKACGSTEDRGESLGRDGTTIGTTNECHMKEKDVVATPAKAPVGGADGAESEFKPNDTIQTIYEVTENEGSGVNKEETKESLGQNLTMSSKDGGATTDKEAPEQVLVKSVERRSGSMISKVKKSIVKVRKAIFGKSPRSKTIASEEKDEIKVK